MRKRIFNVREFLCVSLEVILRNYVKFVWWNELLISIDSKKGSLPIDRARAYSDAEISVSATEIERTITLAWFIDFITGKKGTIIMQRK